MEQRELDRVLRRRLWADHLGPMKAIFQVLSLVTTSVKNRLVAEWSEPLQNWYSQRSVLTANTAATFADRLENVCRDTAFLLGLFQDIGIPILKNSFPQQLRIDSGACPQNWSPGTGKARARCAAIHPRRCFRRTVAALGVSTFADSNRSCPSRRDPRQGPFQSVGHSSALIIRGMDH